MNPDDLCVIIAEKYYQDIYKYCYVKLNFDENAAKDCTQDVFLTMIQKKNNLNLGGNMRVWLYRTADRVMKHYWRKEKKRQSVVSLENIELSDDGGLSDIEHNLEHDPRLKTLTSDEYQLITEYYNSEYGHKDELARKHGLTLYELYKEIERIKKKIKSF